MGIISLFEKLWGQTTIPSKVQNGLVQLIHDIIYLFSLFCPFLDGDKRKVMFIDLQKKHYHFGHHGAIP